MENSQPDTKAQAHRESQKQYQARLKEAGKPDRNRIRKAIEVGLKSQIKLSAEHKLSAAQRDVINGIINGAMMDMKADGNIDMMAAKAAVKKAILDIS